MKPFQEITGIVAKKRNLTADVLFLSLKVPKSFTFRAGQFVSVKIEKDGETKMRSYSILSPPSKEGYLDLCIKVLADGFASEVFTKCKKGDSFTIKGPLGHFAFDESGKDHWFICTGAGITPFYSMVYQYLEKFPKQNFTLLFGVRYERDLFFYEEFIQLAKEHDNFRFIPTLSQEKWTGKFGRVQKHLPNNLKGKTFYICGLKELVLETKELLLEKGVNSTDINIERYT
jgi:ferredoxin-NADP reductase